MREYLSTYGPASVPADFGRAMARPLNGREYPINATRQTGRHRHRDMQQAHRAAVDVMRESLGWHDVMLRAGEELNPRVTYYGEGIRQTILADQAGQFVQVTTREVQA